VEQYPPSLRIPSTHNTRIEGFWRWLRVKVGHEVKEYIVKGMATGDFDCGSELHAYVSIGIYILVLTVIQGIVQLALSAFTSAEAGRVLHILEWASHPSAEG
jgi:hypothetical protein